MVAVMAGGCSTSSLAVRSKVGGKPGGGRGGGPSAKFPHAFSQQINASRQKKKKLGACKPSTGLYCPPSPTQPLFLFFPPVSLISSICFQGQLHATPQTTNNFPFQRYLTLPNPRPSLHPDVANALHSPTVSHREAGPRQKAHLFRLISNACTESTTL